MQRTVKVDDSSSNPFSITSGVKQGCVLAPTLFVIFLDVEVHVAFESSEDGVFLETGSDGKLFNLKAKKKSMPSTDT